MDEMRAAWQDAIISECKAMAIESKKNNQRLCYENQIDIGKSITDTLMLDTHVLFQVV